MQLINDISSGLKKLLNYFNGTVSAAVFRIPLASLSTLAAVFPNNLTLHLKDLNLSPLAITALKLVASSLE